MQHFVFMPPLITTDPTPALHHITDSSQNFMSEVSIFVVVDGLPYQLYLLENINGEIIGTIFSMGKTSEGLILQSE